VLPIGERSANQDEVARYMRREQAEQCDEAKCIDITG
jgi:hypothetical protein